jgi:hypothetical protein
MKTGFDPAEINTSRPHPARMYNVFLGGKDNYAADQEAARRILRTWPEVRAAALANRAFLQRAVRYLAAEAGIRQIIDIGTGIPSAGNVHEVAAEIAPETRVVYVDNDPIVHVHANALLTGSGTTTIILADLREPQAILADPALHAVIDFTQPVALLLVAIMHFIADEEDPAGIIATLRDALPPGSYLALSHGTADFHPPGLTERAAAMYQNAAAPLRLRSYPQIKSLFDGFDLVEPGLVQPPLWRPEGKPPRQKNIARIGMYAGVGRR